MATKANVLDRTGNLLGILSHGRELDSDKETRINTAYAEVYADLKDDELAIWASNGTIPDDIVPHLVALMAFNCCDEFGVSGDRYNRIVTRQNIAKREIRRLTTPDYESLTESVDY